MLASRPFGEVDGNPDRSCGEALADVALALVDGVGEELLPRVAGDLRLERVEQHQHRRRDDRLLDRLGGDLLVLLHELRRVALLPEGTARQPGQLPVMPVVAAARSVTQQQCPDLLGPPGRFAVSLSRGDDRALHHDVPLAREGRRDRTGAMSGPADSGWSPSGQCQQGGARCCASEPHAEGERSVLLEPLTTSPAQQAGRDRAAPMAGRRRPPEPRARRFVEADRDPRSRPGAQILE